MMQHLPTAPSKQYVLNGYHHAQWHHWHRCVCEGRTETKSWLFDIANKLSSPAALGWIRKGHQRQGEFSFQAPDPGKIESAIVLSTDTGNRLSHIDPAGSALQIFLRVNKFCWNSTESLNFILGVSLGFAAWFGCFNKEVPIFQELLSWVFKTFDPEAFM